MSEYLDPEEFPFTETELRAALALARNTPEIQQLGADLVEGIRSERDTRLRAAAAIARGSRDPVEINFAIFVYPAEIVALLADLSPELDRRVHEWRQRQRDVARQGRTREAMLRAGLDPRAVPSPSVESQLAAEDALEQDRWRAMRAAVRADWIRLHDRTRPDDVT